MLLIFSLVEVDNEAVRMGGVAVISMGAVDKGGLDEMGFGVSVAAGAEVADDEVAALEFFTPDSISMTESKVLAGGVVII